MSDQRAAEVLAEVLAGAANAAGIQAAGEALAAVFEVETADALATLGSVLRSLPDPEPLVRIRPETIKRMTR